MAEIADGIRIVEPAQEHFESYQKACEKSGRIYRMKQ